MTTRALLLSLAALGGCTVVKGDGNLTAETREVSAFDAVELPGSLEVEVFAGSEAAGVTLTCDENLLRYIDTVVRGSTLVVAEADRTVLKPSGDCYATVAVPDLVSIEASGSGGLFGRQLGDVVTVVSTGSGSIDLGGFAAASLTIDASGSSDLILGGSAEELTVRSSGSGDLDARAIQAGDVLVRSSGSGDVMVAGTGIVDARSSGSGDVHVYGDPEGVAWDNTGSGEIVLH